MTGVAESDGYNTLVLAAGLAWRDVTLVRTISRFLRQASTMAYHSFGEIVGHRQPRLSPTLPLPEIASSHEQRKRDPSRQ